MSGLDPTHADPNLADFGQLAADRTAGGGGAEPSTGEANAVQGARQHVGYGGEPRTGS